uniref:Uncharacterized protein n=1 Tax=Solanum lycopersicum TaxID=4081 RepID=A0A3Q7FFM2_SOLLC
MIVVTFGILFQTKKFKLPPFPAECDILKCLLSAPPHDPECLVIFQIKETLDDDDTDDDENENSIDANNKNEDENKNTNNKDEDENDNTNNKDEDENENSDEDSNEDEDEDEDVNRLTFYFCKPGYNTEFHKQDVQSIIRDPRDSFQEKDLCINGDARYSNLFGCR